MILKLGLIKVDFVLLNVLTKADNKSYESYFFNCCFSVKAV